VSCRNLLIYLGTDVQGQILPTFHYALRPGGYLFLGTSESVSQYADLFAPIDKKHRIFRSRDDAAALVRVPNLVHAVGLKAGAGGLAGERTKLSGIAIRQMVDAQVLERHAPPHVLVNGDGEVLYYSARTGKYLEQPSGVPSRQLLTIARKGLLLDLRIAFNEARETKRRSTRKSISMDTDDGRVQLITLTVEPVADHREHDPLYLILFTDEEPAVAHEAVSTLAASQSNEAALHLERELRETKDRLQGMVEEYETSVEELKSSNEELVSVNEELQSANEELEASKEELQSLNEELNTINTELSTKVEDLDRSNTDLQNLFDSTQVATVFLDRNLVIRSFTPAVGSIFNIRQVDRGRPLTDLSSRIPLPNFETELQSVFDRGSPIERRIETNDTAHYLVRMIPYRGSHDEVDGVVVAFIDVSSLAKAEAHQRVLVAELNHRVKNMLTIAVALAQQPKTTGVSTEEFQRNLVERLRALAGSYSSLANENWNDLDLAQLIERELMAFGRERYILQGPTIKVQPRVALSLGMVLHELTTNAAKYGALSGRDGKIAVSWSAEKGALEVVWREQDGPSVAVPDHQGFGLKLVSNELAYSLSGKIDLEFEPTGLTARLHCTL
jgi:two-component system CheB/CheR fusion protein